MPTIICKRINTDGIPDGGQAAYNHDLTAYMANPESTAGTEKCFATFSSGFTHPKPTPEEVACEFTMDCDLVHTLRSSGVDHWVLSFSETRRKISLHKIASAVHGWIVDMGYANFHKFFAAVHKDTDNIHVHIAVCRVNALTGKVKERGFWKNQNQLAITRVAKAEDWSLEDGSDKFICPRNSRPEPVIIRDPVFGTSNTIWRPCVIPVSSWKGSFVLGEKQSQNAGSKKMPFPGDKASRFEHFTGVKSDKRYLLEKLAEVLDELPEFPHWLDLHEALAKRGILMERRTHKNGRYGLIFSRDGRKFQAAKKVCPQLSWNALSIRIKETWTPVNPEFFEKYTNLSVMPETIKKIFNIVSDNGKARTMEIATEPDNKDINVVADKYVSSNRQNKNSGQKTSSTIIRSIMHLNSHEEKIRLHCISRIQTSTWNKRMPKEPKKGTNRHMSANCQIPKFAHRPQLVNLEPVPIKITESVKTPESKPELKNKQRKIFGPR